MHRKDARGRQPIGIGLAVVQLMLLSISSSVSAQAYISSAGSFTATNQSVDFYFSLPAAPNNLTLRTYQYSGGTSAIGTPWVGGGVDSTLNLFAAAGGSIAFNDDLNGASGNRDSLLSYAGTGSTLLAAQPAGDYRMRLATFNGGLTGSGLWVADIIDTNHNLVGTGATRTASSTFSEMYFGASAGFTSTLALADGAGLNNVQVVWLRQGGLLNLSGGSLTANLLAFDSTSTVSTIGSGTILVNYFSIGQSYTSGEVHLNGGFVSAANLNVGFNVGGILTQNGGSVLTDNLTIAGGVSGGPYTLNDGVLNVTTSFAVALGGFSGANFTENGGTAVTPRLLVGGSGAGDFVQTGGSFTVTDAAGVIVGDTPVLPTYRSAMTFSGGIFDTTNLAVKYGSVFANPAGLVNVAGAATVSTSSQISVQGGTLNAGTIVVNAGGSLNFSSGTIGLTNSDLSVGPGGLFGNNMSLGIGRNLIVAPSGTTIIQPGCVLSIDGGLFSTGALTNGGQFQLAAGTFQLTNSPLTIGPSGLLGDQVQLNSGQHIHVTSQPVTVAGNSILYLNGGSLRADVGINNSGQIQLAGGLTGLAGGVLNNSGLIFGSGRIDDALNNLTGGEVRAMNSSFLIFHGPSNTNAGKLVLLDGVMQFDQPLSNTGSITGHGTVIAPNLINSGTVLLSGGVSDVFSPLANNSGAKVIVTGGSNSSFYDDVANSAGSEFRVSTGSAAVFLGNVTGLGQFTGSGVKIFEGSASLGPIVSAVGTTMIEPSGTLLATAVRDSSLIVNGSATITAKASANNASGTSVVKSLAIDLGAELDLTNNSMVIDYTSVGTLVDDVRQHLHSGRMTSSSADASKRLGYGDNAVLGKTTFAGQTVDTTSLLVKFTWAGDTNLDGQVTISDLGDLASNWQSTTAVWTKGDFNYDGSVTIADLGDLASNWQAGVGSPLGMSFAEALAAVGLGDVVVPEPGAMAIFGLAALLGRKRRH